MDQKIYFKVLSALVFLLICRIIASYFIPLNDSTEARYGEIARKMLETNNWITLLHDYGVPFWAKPPLSTWLSALSMKILGVSEFAARLPSLLLSFGIIGLIADLARKQSGSIVGAMSALVLSGSLYFILDAGAVMTDPSLLFCITLSMVSFWHALVFDKKIWSYCFFVGLGLGLLAKGPIAIVLVGIPVFFWVLMQNQRKNLWQRLPWFSGFLLVLAIALPWYILAEMKTPGFLNYFIVGEHINRFLVPGWAGDKYGMAHDAPKGMIWIYGIAGIFPWSILAVIWLVRHARKLPSLCFDSDGWMRYLILFMTTPLIFFSFASNIIYPYVFPALPAFALFFTEVWNRSTRSIDNGRWIIGFSLTCGVVFLVGTFLFEYDPDLVAKTQKPIVMAWEKHKPEKGSTLIYWDNGPDFSAQFYSAGHARATKNVDQLCDYMFNHRINYLVVKSSEQSEIPPQLFSQSTIIDTLRIKNNDMLLVKLPLLKDDCHLIKTVVSENKP